jgi:hypothetical protein
MILLMDSIVSPLQRDESFIVLFTQGVTLGCNSKRLRRNQS